MRLRPWHLLVVVIALGGGLVAVGSVLDDRAKDVPLGLGLNLLSAVVFFVLLELYWARVKRANGKEVGGFDYRSFSRNIDRSAEIRVLATFIYPLTHHPKHATDRAVLLAALQSAVQRPTCRSIRLLFIRPDGVGAKLRAAERKDEDVMARLAEMVTTLTDLIAGLDADAAARIEVRLSDRMPAFSLFQTDDYASIAFYNRDKPLSAGNRYEFFTDTALGEFVERTFDDLWQDERTIPLAAVERR